jgi:hypothetical protein
MSYPILHIYSMIGTIVPTRGLLRWPSSCRWRSPPPHPPPLRQKRALHSYSEFSSPTNAEAKTKRKLQTNQARVAAPSWRRRRRVWQGRRAWRGTAWAGKGVGRSWGFAGEELGFGSGAGGSHGSAAAASWRLRWGWEPGSTWAGARRIGDELRLGEVAARVRLVSLDQKLTGQICRTREGL